MLRTNAPKTLLHSEWMTNASSPLPPSFFNPDPGAMLKPEASNAPFFTNVIFSAPVFSGDAIPQSLELPRTNVRSEVLEFTNPPVGGYGKELLPQKLKLPRENTRGNEYIKTKWETRAYPAPGNYALPPFAIPETNRWRIGFVPWRRYTSGDIEQPYKTPQPMLWRPYAQSILKGDAPIIGQDIFLNLTAGSETTFELRRIPTPSAISSANPNSAEFFGRSEQMFMQNNFSFTMDLFKGQTVFQPVHWALRLEPVFNVNYTDTRENNVISPNPQRGTDRFDEFVALQQAFVEIHLRDLSDDYDFIASRFGNQAFNSDFRGFIFNDVNLAARIFGNYDNNRWQYNLAVFDMRREGHELRVEQVRPARPGGDCRECVSAGFHLARIHRATELSREPRPRRNALRRERQSRAACAARYSRAARRELVLLRLGG